MRVYQAGQQQLIVLEVDSSEVCQTGLREEAEMHWKQDEDAVKAALRSRCANVKHVFQRTARDCPDCTFLALEVSTCCHSFYWPSACDSYNLHPICNHKCSIRSCCFVI